MENNSNKLLEANLNSTEYVNQVFNFYEKELIDKKEIVIDLSGINFVSVFFLRRLEEFTKRAKDLNAKVQITNATPTVYKVFHVAKSKDILEAII